MGMSRYELLDLRPAHFAIEHYDNETYTLFKVQRCRLYWQASLSLCWSYFFVRRNENATAIFSFTS
jgi:hypothetical protein